MGEAGTTTVLDRVVNLGHSRIICLSSEMVARLLGSHSNTRRRIRSSSKDNGKMVFKKLASLR